MQTSLYLFLFQYICLYAIKVLLATAGDFFINMNVMAHGHVGPEFINVKMYLCVMLDLYHNVGMDHQPPRQLKFSVGQGVNRLDAIFSIVPCD